MTPAELTTYWKENFGIEPEAHRLREILSHRWFRIHTLPNSKRYPENAVEFAIILARHNAVLSALLESEQAVMVLTTRYSANDDPSLFPEGSWHWTTYFEDPDDERWHWPIYARRIDWRPGILDSVLRLVAQDKTRNLMVLGIQSRVAYHPYDGGGDVIARDAHHRETLRERFCQWLSPYPRGL